MNFPFFRSQTPRQAEGASRVRVRGFSKTNEKGFGLLIGDDAADGRAVYYSGERGLCTIAPPESGKTQCHIQTNLLKWPGPAIVLDVTGNLWRDTSKERSKSFGPVYRIDPDHPGQSDHYNPFSYIRTDADHVWGDASTFASQLYSRQGSGGKGDGGNFFNMAAPQYLATLTAYTALTMPPALRNCETLLRLVSGMGYDAFLAKAADTDILGLQATAGMLKRADSRTRGNVEWTVKNCLAPWENPQTAAISRVSDWHPSAIRKHNATVYICVSLKRLIDSPGLVRLILGQHLTEFMEPTEGTADPAWVQLFIDEAPQLRHMDVLTRAIEVGRNHKVRLWMAMQWKGQLVEAYGKETAEGMIGACGLQAYMNPPLIDSTADDVSKQIGIHYDRMDQSQRPKLPPQTLAGTEFAKDVIAFDYGNYTRLRKHWCFQDPELMEMIGPSP